MKIKEYKIHKYINSCKVSDKPPDSDLPWPCAKLPLARGNTKYIKTKIQICLNESTRIYKYKKTKVHKYKTKVQNSPSDSDLPRLCESFPWQGETQST